MKLNPILSAVIAVSAVATPTVMFGAAADLDSCCTPADKDQPKVGANLGNQSYSSLSQISRKNISNLGAAWRVNVGAAPATTPPVESVTTPETPVWADADRANNSRNAERNAVRMTGK